MRARIVKPVQWAVYALLFPARLLIRREGVCRVKGLANRPYVIASNHPTRIDAFVAILALPPRTALQLMPIRFLTAAEYMRNPVARICLRLLGCISTENGKEKVTHRLVRHLKERQSIYVFPGGRMDARRKPTARIGVVYLEKHVPGTHILPVHISRHGLTWRVAFREPIRHKKYPTNLQPLADDVMLRINGEISRKPRTRE